jgi:hypothetical protein
VEAVLALVGVLDVLSVSCQSRPSARRRRFRFARQLTKRCDDGLQRLPEPQPRGLKFVSGAGDGDRTRDPLLGKIGFRDSYLAMPEIRDFSPEGPPLRSRSHSDFFYCWCRLSPHRRLKWPQLLSSLIIQLG